jgi:threonine synthase
MTISMPAASAARKAAQLRGLIRGPVEGISVPSMSIAISWILTPLFYLLAAPVARRAHKCKPLKYHRVMPSIAYLECSRCQAHISAETAQSLCPQCAGALYVRYDMAALRQTAKRHEIAARAAAASTSLGMWRYAAVLPAAEPVTLGEGFTPILRSRRYPNLFLKEEAANPTGTFKARGLSLAVTMARHYGLKKLAVPSAGNAAGALAAYAAAAGIEAHIFMPRDVPLANYLESVAYGANVTLVDGLISDCARIVAQRKEAEGWFDISSLKEPFRVEGKKTMGYELVEQSGWRYPDAVFYPTGGGVGLIGMWKAFEEMESLGWVSGRRRPKMIAVQASGCAPIAKAFREGETVSQMWPDATTFASGLRVPKPYGDALILEIVRESGGLALDFDDQQILASLLDWARHEGLFLSPEGAAATAAYDQLIGNGWLSPEDKVVIFNTGAGLKYADVTAAAMHLAFPPPAIAGQREVEKDHRGVTLPARHRAGGIITPQ